MKNKDDLREVNEESLNIVSMSFNSHIMLFVKNNGECYITDGNANPSEMNLNINTKILAEYSLFSLKNSLKLTGSLNKKYLIKVACGTSHVILLTHAGMVFSLGKGENGQLGHGDTKDSGEPQMITSLLNFRIFEISVGGDHNLALGSMRDLARKSTSSLNTLENKKEQIFLYSWGDNSKGQIGLKKNLQLSNAPKLIEYFTNKNLTIKKISCGIDHSLVLTDNGKVFGFGSNTHNQLGFENSQSEGNSTNCVYEPFRIRYKTYNNSDIKIKHKFLYVKCSSFSSLLITDRNIVILYGNNHREDDQIFCRNLICKEKNSNKNVNLYEIIHLESPSDSEINFILKNENLFILYDKIKYDLSLETQVEFHIESPIPTEENIINKIRENFHLRLHTNSNELEGEYVHSHTQQTPDDTGFLHDFEISKEFFSDNASTNELFDNNISFEQSIEELRNYISLVGISFVGDPGNSSLSFRPKNLPKKTQQEEDYHRKLVEDNRKRYMRFLKDKHEEERRIKDKQDRKKLKLKKLQEVWENEILPNWFKKKRDYNYIKKYFYEGIPTSLRGRVWLLCIGNNFSITPEYYEIEVKKAVNILQQLQYSEIQAKNEVNNININRSNFNNSNNNLSKSNDNSEKILTTVSNNKYNIKIIDKEKSIKYIDLDIERTFPYLGIFKGNSPLGEDLREILQAFVASRPDIGYVRKINN
jgi:alpha-tubulin suppressor-like RCC1 family protein